MFKERGLPPPESDGGGGENRTRVRNNLRTRPTCVVSSYGQLTRLFALRENDKPRWIFYEEARWPRSTF